MKKAIYLFLLLFSLVLMSTGCKKDDPIVLSKEKTLLQRYPDWANLSWISTNGNTNRSTTFPQLSIRITEDYCIILTETIYISQLNIGATAYNYSFYDIIVTPTTIQFGNQIIGAYLPDGIRSSPPYIEREYAILVPPDNTKIKLSYNGNTYILQKN